MSKRNLTKTEIENILDFIPIQKKIPENSAKANLHLIKERMRRDLKKQKIYPKLIPELKEEMRKMYFSSLVAPGESVGVITAQSIGEKQTQMTLNSIDWKEAIIYTKDGVTYTEPIGKFIDDLLLKQTENITHISENRTEYLPLPEGYKIPSCDEHGMCDWYRIEAITRHLPVGQLVRVKTASGRVITATQSKSFLVWNGNTFEATKGCDIKLGDILPTTQRLPKPCENGYFDTDYGYFIGTYLARGWSFEGNTYFNYKPNCKTAKRIIKYCEDNNIEYKAQQGEKVIIYKNLKNECGDGENKRIPDYVYTASDTFIKTVIGAYFSRNGIVNENYNGNIIIPSASKHVIEGISFLLSYFNIYGRKYKRHHKYSHVLRIRNGYIKKFYNHIQVYDNCIIQSIMDKMCLISIENNGLSQEDFPDRDVYFDKVISVEYTVGTTEYVYDLTVEKTRNFQLLSGLNVRDTFHKAGMSEKTVTEGVPRFEELINATKNPKNVSCKVYFTEGTDSIQNLRKTIGKSIVEFTLGKLAQNIRIVNKPKLETWEKVFKILYNNKYTEYDYAICIDLNLKYMYEYKIDIEFIAEKIEDVYDDLYCVFSPIHKAKLYIYVKTSVVEEFTEEQLLYITSENKQHIYLEEVVIPTLEQLLICGIPGISFIFYMKDDDEWMIETEGSNFQMLLNHPKVDPTRTISNDIWDIYNVLGMQAVKNAFKNELMDIMSGINPCHANLLVDMMTHSKNIASISRYTMRKQEVGPFGKASFEETLDNFLKAAVYGDIEPTQGVSASIICGKAPRMGTGLCDLYIDVKNLPKIENDFI